MNARRIFWLVVTICILLAMGCYAQSNLIFILDASNSMNKAFENETRIEAAKGALIILLPAVDTATSAKLYVFGHRIDHTIKPESCHDIELLFPALKAAGADHQIVQDGIRGLVAQGMTPIAEALRTAADGIGDTPYETTIILLTDSAETCGGDPLAVAQDIASMEPNVVLEIIGLDIPADECDALDEIASATGGTYCGVGTAADLLQALYEASGSATVSGEGQSGIPEEYAGYNIDNVIRGTDGDDLLHGTPGNDLILGFGGNDLIIGFDGDDVLVGGDGNDILEGLDGNDVLFGEAGADLILGGSGDDRLAGGVGNDSMEGESGNDELYGGPGADRLLGGEGCNLLHVDAWDWAYEGQLIPESDGSCMPKAP